MEKLPPTVMVTFGITGDLSQRYFLPALGQIKRAGLLGDFKLIGITRRDIKKTELLNKDCANLAGHVEILKMDVGAAADYRKLKQTVMRAAGKRHQIILHLSVPPEIVPRTVGYLADAGLNDQRTKLLLEKPFGFDYRSAEALCAEINRSFSEQQTYRIDHYLAKQMAQNLAVLIDGNVLLSNVWSRKYINRIDITVAETIGVEGRTDFYESTGALRDIVQSHGLQLAALTLMKSTKDVFGLKDLPKLRLSALNQLRANPAKTTRAQYKGYRKEVAHPQSHVETFVRLELHSTDRRWKGVPIYLTTGKKLDAKLTEICITFKSVKGMEADQLTFRIQPREGAEMSIWIKEPGYENRLKKLPLAFNYGKYYERLPDAYERVLVDVMRSDHSLFASSQEVLASWKVLQPVLDLWQKDSADLKFYNPGSTIEQVLGL